MKAELLVRRLVRSQVQTRASQNEYQVGRTTRLKSSSNESWAEEIRSRQNHSYDVSSEVSYERDELEEFEKRSSVVSSKVLYEKDDPGDLQKCSSEVSYERAYLEGLQ
jgi:hypothetical protein